MASFIKDFDRQVKNIVEELKARVVKNLKEVDRRKRTSKRGLATPSNSRLIDTSVLGYTPAITPKIDARLFKTPGLRTTAMQEPVYTFSANGSPLAGMDEIYLNVPTAEEKHIRLMFNKVENIDLSRLDKQASENLKMLSSQLEKICKKLK
ncbi:borealin-like [Rhinophrynus dorsalis]